MHKSIKRIMASKLNEWFGVAITEYPSSGQELDIFSINTEGIKLTVEIIWTPSWTNFLRDMMLLLRTEAHIKIPVVQSSVLQNPKFVREFQKTAVSELNRGTIVTEMLNGNRILDNNDYLENYVKSEIMKSVTRLKEKNATHEPFRVSVLPTETTEVIEDTTFARLKIYLDRIRPTSTESMQLTAWSDLEKQAISKRIWKIPEVWQKLTDEILSGSLGIVLNGAFSVLNRMLITSAVDAEPNDAADKAYQLYRAKLEEILGSTEDAVEDYKMQSKQLLEHIANKNEMFQICWHSWMKCMREIKDNNRYERFVRCFINDLVYASKENKESIEEELYNLMGSTEELTSSRARELHNLMFS